MSKLSLDTNRTYRFRDGSRTGLRVALRPEHENDWKYRYYIVGDEPNGAYVYTEKGHYFDGVPNHEYDLILEPQKKETAMKTKKNMIGNLDADLTYRTRNGKHTGLRIKKHDGDRYVVEVIDKGWTYTKDGHYWAGKTTENEFDLIAENTAVETTKPVLSDINVGDYVTVRARVTCKDNWYNTISISESEFTMDDIVTHEKVEFKVGDTVKALNHDARILFITEDKKNAMIEYTNGINKGYRETVDTSSLSRS